MNWLQSSLSRQSPASDLIVVRMAEERPKPDAQRDIAFQERNWNRIEQGQKSFVGPGLVVRALRTDDEEREAIGKVDEVGGCNPAVDDRRVRRGRGEFGAIENGAVEFFADADEVAGDTEERR